MEFKIRDRVLFRGRLATVTAYLSNEGGYILRLDQPKNGSRAAIALRYELKPLKEQTVNEPQTQPQTDNLAYFQAAVAAAIRLAKTQETLTADDVQNDLGKAPVPGATTVVALNQVMRGLVTGGVLEASANMTRSTRTGGPIRVWKSKLFEGVNKGVNKEIAISEARRKYTPENQADMDAWYGLVSAREKLLKAMDEATKANEAYTKADTIWRAARAAALKKLENTEA